MKLPVRLASGFALALVVPLFTTSFHAAEARPFRWMFNESPVCHGARATIEGPLDRALAPVTIEDVTDPNGDPLTIVVTAITQDEPVMEKGRRATCPDAAITAGVAQVRRERSVSGNGRVYVFFFTASDGGGGECQGTAKLCIPRIRGINGAGCVDDGQDYDSLAECAGATNPGISPRGVRTTR
jgi:hypothetical protein